MLTDTHFHPFYLEDFPYSASCQKILAAASACEPEEFAYNEELARKSAIDGSVTILPCFAIHPQQIAVNREQTVSKLCSLLHSEGMTTLCSLASEGRLAAVGECGFDLFNSVFKATEAEQDRVFADHLKVALRYDLPVILHVRRAMHKIFALAKTLAKCKAVVFHSWSGTLEEGQAILRHKVNAYFSFGNSIINKHSRAMRCCALFPAERLLTETDAPYQPQRGKSFSHWDDLPVIIKAAAALRHEAKSPIADAAELEARIEQNFRTVFMPHC